MSLRPPNIVELLAVARDLVVHLDFDAEVVVEWCDALLSENKLDAQLVGAVTHARLVSGAAALNGSSAQITVARFALARVVVLLEKHIGPGLVSQT